MNIRLSGIGPVSLEELEARFSAYMNAGAPEPVLQGAPAELQTIFELIAKRGDSQMKSLMQQLLTRLHPN